MSRPQAVLPLLALGLFSALSLQRCVGGRTMARPQPMLPLLALGLFLTLSLAASQSLPSSGLDCSAITSSAATPYRNLVTTNIPASASTLFVGPFPENQDTQAYQQCCQKCQAANKKTAGSCTGYTVQVSMTQYDIRTSATRVRYWCQLVSTPVTVKSAPVITNRVSRVQYFSATFQASSSSSSSGPPIKPWDPLTGSQCPFKSSDRLSPPDNADLEPSISGLFNGVTSSNILSKLGSGVAKGRIHVVNLGNPTLVGTRVGTTLLTCAQAACERVGSSGGGYFTWEADGKCSVFSDAACSVSQSQASLGLPWEPVSDGTAFTAYLGFCSS